MHTGQKVLNPLQVGNQDVQLTMKPIPKHLGPLSPAGALLSSIIRLRVHLPLPTCESPLNSLISTCFSLPPRSAMGLRQGCDGQILWQPNFVH